MTNEKKVVCGFPGVGKSYLADREDWQDSDSSLFSWVKTGTGKIRNPNFPANYIEHIKSCDRNVLVSSHKEVRDALAEAGIPFILVYPQRLCKNEYLDRYERRGSPKEFVELLDKMWDQWINEMEAETRCVERIVLPPLHYLGDYFCG